MGRLVLSFPKRNYLKQKVYIEKKRTFFESQMSRGRVYSNYAMAQKRTIENKLFLLRQPQNLLNLQWFFLYSCIFPLLFVCTYTNAAVNHAVFVPKYRVSFGNDVQRIVAERAVAYN